jgi:nucleoid DNA-binding protein
VLTHSREILNLPPVRGTCCRTEQTDPTTRLATKNHATNQRHMNKAELVELIQKNMGGDTSKRAAADALEAVLTSLAKGIKGGNVQLIGFGTFKVATRKARTGRNPKTGEAMKIKASKTVCLRPSCSSAPAASPLRQSESPAFLHWEAGLFLGKGGRFGRISRISSGGGSLRLP